MVLASTGDKVSLEELAQLADKIVEVAVPSVSAVSVPQLKTEVEQLRADVTRLTELVRKSLLGEDLREAVHLALPNHAPHPTPPSVSTTSTSDAKHLVLSRETIRPFASGDDCYWPIYN